MQPISILYFSDVLCIWAYLGHVRLEELERQFGDQIAIEVHYCSVFADARKKIEEGWRDKGGYSGFNTHLKEVAARFPHISLNEDLWIKVKPHTSASAHLFLKAIEMLEEEETQTGGLKISRNLQSLPRVSCSWAPA